MDLCGIHKDLHGFTGIMSSINIITITLVLGFTRSCEDSHGLIKICEESDSHSFVRICGIYMGSRGILEDAYAFMIGAEVTWMH